MTLSIGPWSRPLYVRQPRRASVAFLVVHDAPLQPASPPPIAPEYLAHIRFVDLIEEAQPQLFQTLREHPARALAEADLGGGAAVIDRTRFATSVSLEIEDPPDLAYLRAAWGCVAWLVGRGGLLVEDLCAGRWWLPEDAKQYAQRPQVDIGNEVRFVFDIEPVLQEGNPQPARVLNTRGMRKFARPDLVAVIREDQLAHYEQLFAHKVTEMAFGQMPAAGAPLFLQPDESPMVQQLMLYNEAWSVRTAKGNHPAFD